VQIHPYKFFSFADEWFIPTTSRSEVEVPHMRRRVREEDAVKALGDPARRPACSGASSR